VVLLEELGHVHDQVADDRQARQRAQGDRLLEAAQVGHAGQAVLAVDVHRVRAADAFAAGATEGQGVIHRLQLDQGVQQLDIGGVNFDLDVLHVGLGVLVRVVAVKGETHFFHESTVGFDPPKRLKFAIRMILI
jgi:hypothetical protein